MNKNWLVHNGTTAQEIVGLVKKMIIDLSYSPENERMSNQLEDVSFPTEIVRFLGDIPLIWCFIQVLFLWCWWQCCYLCFPWLARCASDPKTVIGAFASARLYGVVAGGKIWLTRMILVDCFLLFSCCFLVVFLVALC